MTSITAIVPTYNRSALLKETLQSLAAQTRPVDEIIVWDDGSTDDTEAVVRAAEGPIRYFRTANSGKSRALNAALREAMGDLVWICDDDDLALPHAAERLSTMLVDAPTADVAAGGYVRFRVDPVTGEQVEFGPGYWPDLREGSVLRHLLEDLFLFQNATMVRRSLYDRVGPFREDLARSIDYDMAVRLALNATIVVTDETLFRQRKHDGERGPAAARHAAAQSEAVWKEADQAVFAPFREAIQLSVYSGLFEGELASRAGLLQRACVYARRTDWNAATDDFVSAAALHPNTALTLTERAICRRAMAGKHGVAEVLSPTMRQRLVRLARSGPVGAEIAAGLGRGVLWRGRAALRDRQIGEAARVFRFALFLIAAAQGRKDLQQASPLVERRQPLFKLWEVDGPSRD